MHSVMYHMHFWACVVLYLPHAVSLIVAEPCVLIQAHVSEKGGIAASIGILPEFHLQKGPFTAFVNHVQFRLATQWSAEDKHVAMLLSTIDDETYPIIRNLLAPILLIQILEAHLKP